MASINLRDVVLYDRWPGYPDPNLSEPTCGFDSTTQCSSTPVWPLGTKIQKYNDSTYGPGYFTMCYMQFVEGTDQANDVGDPSNGHCACFHIQDCCGHTPGATHDLWYMITNDLTNSDGTMGGAIAFPANDLSGNSTTEQNECGWCWVGGVNPCITTTNFKDCTRLAGDMTTDGNVTQGKQIAVQDDGTNAAELCLYDASYAYCVTGSLFLMAPIGWALADDA
jgi:hypothetical protein